MKVDPHYDLLIVGGGITGAAVLHAASRRGLKALLVDRGDFASGTSSWSSKLIHGGMRYLKSGQWRLTLESVRERERLLLERPGLVEPQPFLMPLYEGGRPGPRALGAAFWIADRMAGRRTARRIDAAEALALEPLLAAPSPATRERAGGEGPRLEAAIAYRDGVVDDARLVLRLIFDAVGHGAHALNHVGATLLESDGRVTGARLEDRVDGDARDVSATVTVHATGVWAGAAPGAPALRPLRGSHLVFARETLPLRSALAWLHPRDRRPVFAHVWEGAVVVGTTDIDHPLVDVPATISPAEAAYLVEALALPLPHLRLDASMALSAFAGLRAIVVPPGELDRPPSAMGRDSAMWARPGLVGITGGKLTTHRATADEVLHEVEKQGLRVLPAAKEAVSAPATTRLQGRLGPAGAAWVAARPAEEGQPLAGTPYSLAELRWSLREEQVRHLDDLLMRRTRLGLVAARGAEALLPLLEAPCREALGWDAARWADEVARYRENWAARHAPPPDNRRP
ncbi:MAG: glycerol-3-phosphate dehydrogenase/oxidase [Burkholderiales bacterium]|nr:glycerol-3-phosphate dehydrogenase/oxidase [Burkholderiales bacterium]